MKVFVKLINKDIYFLVKKDCGEFIKVRNLHNLRNEILESKTIKIIDESSVPSILL